MATAGWYTDPQDSTQLRWWNGQAWTEHRSPVAPVEPAAAIVPVAAPEPRWAPPASSADAYRVPVPPVAPQAQTPQAQTPQAQIPQAQSAVAPYVYPIQVFAAPPTYPFDSRESNHSTGSPRRTRLFVLGGIGVLVIVAALVGVNLVPKLSSTPTASSTNAPAQYLDAPPATAPAVPLIDQPGMVGQFTQVASSGQPSVESSEFALQTSHYAEEGMNARCAPLAFGAPVNGSARDSIDPMVNYFRLVSPSGDTTISGEVQAFPTAQDATNYSTSVSALLTSCEGGFPDGDGTDTVTPANASYAGLTATAWTQTVKTSSRSYTVQTVELRRDNLVSRSFCYQVSGTKDNPLICSNWAHEVEVAFAHRD